MGITMLENGLDFILDSIFKLQEAETDGKNDDIRENNLKYCLLHLSSGIELILKSRLYREHWTYIFADMNKAKKQNLVNGSLKSADSNTVVERIEQLCEIVISKEDKEILKDLRDARNKMEHYQIDESITAIESKVNRALHLIIEFLNKNYDGFSLSNYLDVNSRQDKLGFTEKEKTLIEKVINETVKLEKHYDDALKIARAKANDEVLMDELLMCPECKEPLLRCGEPEGQSKCYLCGYQENGEHVAKYFLSSILNISEYETIKDGGEYPLYECPDCGAEALVFIEETRMYQCFACGMYNEADDLCFCTECGGIYYRREEDMGLCYCCTRYKLEN